MCGRAGAFPTTTPDRPIDHENPLLLHHTGVRPVQTRDQGLQLPRREHDAAARALGRRGGAAAACGGSACEPSLRRQAAIDSAGASAGTTTDAATACRKAWSTSVWSTAARPRCAAWRPPGARGRRSGGQGSELLRRRGASAIARHGTAVVAARPRARSGLPDIDSGAGRTHGAAVLRDRRVPRRRKDMVLLEPRQPRVAPRAFLRRRRCSRPRSDWPRRGAALPARGRAAARRPASRERADPQGSRSSSA